MPRIPPLLVGCALTGVISVATAWAWLALTGSRTLSPGAIVICAVASVTVALVVEHAMRALRRGRPRRAHARPTPKTRKAA